MRAVVRRLFAVAVAAARAEKLQIARDAARAAAAFSVFDVPGRGVAAPPSSPSLLNSRSYSSSDIRPSPNEESLG